MLRSGVFGVRLSFACLAIIFFLYVRGLYFMSKLGKHTPAGRFILGASGGAVAKNNDDGNNVTNEFSSGP